MPLIKPIIYSGGATQWILLKCSITEHSANMYVINGRQIISANYKQNYPKLYWFCLHIQCAMFPTYRTIQSISINRNAVELNLIKSHKINSTGGLRFLLFISQQILGIFQLQADTPKPHQGPSKWSSIETLLTTHTSVSSSNSTLVVVVGYSMRRTEFRMPFNSMGQERTPANLASARWARWNGNYRNDEYWLIWQKVKRGIDSFWVATNIKRIFNRRRRTNDGLLYPNGSPQSRRAVRSSSVVRKAYFSFHYNLNNNKPQWTHNTRVEHGARDCKSLRQEVHSFCRTDDDNWKNLQPSAVQ